MRIKRYFSLMPKDYAEIKLCRGNYYKGLRGSTRHNVYLHITILAQILPLLRLTRRMTFGSLILDSMNFIIQS